MLQAVIDRVPEVQVELSGGIRDDESLERALGTGADRVNIGTAALEDPDWTAEAIAIYGDRIAVGLDVRGTTLAARGWTSEGGDLYDVLARLEQAGCARYVVTDVHKDGTLGGPNIELLRSVLQATGSPSSRPAGSRASTTSASCARSPVRGSRARSSARPSTPDGSRWARRWRSPRSEGRLRRAALRRPHVRGESQPVRRG